MAAGNLTGPIPEELSTCWPLLVEIDLSYNDITGTIPAFLAKVPKLKQLKLEENRLEGSIPAELADVKSESPFPACVQLGAVHGSMP